MNFRGVSFPSKLSYLCDEILVVETVSDDDRGEFDSGGRRGAVQLNDGRDAALLEEITRVFRVLRQTSDER